jgi:hypothetical protein
MKTTDLDSQKKTQGSRSNTTLSVGEIALQVQENMIAYQESNAGQNPDDSLFKITQSEAIQPAIKKAKETNPTGPGLST